MKISLLGTGLMGRPMAERLLDAGAEVTAWNRTAAAMRPLAEHRPAAHLAASPAEALSASPATLVMLRDAPVVSEVLFADEGAALAGRTVVQMSTIGPRESIALAAAVEARGGRYLEAPVMGGISMARDGKLQVLVGGSSAALAEWSPVLANFGSIVHVGDVGQAATLKLALNQLISTLTTGFALSLGLVRRQGIDIDLFMSVLRKTAFYAPAYDFRLERLRARDYGDPNFTLELLLKDADLALAEAKALGLGTEALVGIRNSLAMAVAQGLGPADYAAAYEAIDPASDPTNGPA